MLIDWVADKAFDDQDRPISIPEEWRRGVRVKANQLRIDVMRYDTDTHLLVRRRPHGCVLNEAPIVEELELEPMPLAFDPEFRNSGIGAVAFPVSVVCG